MASDAIMARPGPRRPSFASSDSVAMPSKPRNDRTPNDTALMTRFGSNVEGLKSGSSEKPRDEGSASSHRTPSTTKTSSTRISSTSATRFTISVSPMPRTFTNVFAATNATANAHGGTSGTSPDSAVEATTYMSKGINR